MWLSVPHLENIEDKRKTVAALFADIKGSMELMQNIKSAVEVVRLSVSRVVPLRVTYRDSIRFGCLANGCNDRISCFSGRPRPTAG